MVTDAAALKEVFSPRWVESVRRTAAERYDLPADIRVSPLNYSENLTFLVGAPSCGFRSILRVNRSGYHTAAELESEMAWMRAIRRDTDLEIPDVIAGKNGGDVQSFPYGDHKADTCCMFGFLTGETPRDLRGAELEQLFRRLGGIAATLHRQVLAWDPPPGLTRFRWDFGALIGPHARWGDWSRYSGMDGERKRLFSAAVSLVSKRLAAFGCGRERFGLIHSDLHALNLLCEGSRIKVLDFDDCGYGWFLYDLASSLLRYNENLEELCGAWLEGYRAVRPLSREDEREIPTFLVMRRLTRLGWLASHPMSASAREMAEDTAYLQYTQTLAEGYLRRFS